MIGDSQEESKRSRSITPKWKNPVIAHSDAKAHVAIQVGNAFESDG